MDSMLKNCMKHKITLVLFSITLLILFFNPSIASADLINTTSVDSSPSEIAINSITNKIYVSNFSDDTVSVIDDSLSEINGNSSWLGGYGDCTPPTIRVDRTTDRKESLWIDKYWYFWQDNESKVTLISEIKPKQRQDPETMSGYDRTHYGLLNTKKSRL